MRPPRATAVATAVLKLSVSTTTSVSPRSRGQPRALAAPFEPPPVGRLVEYRIRVAHETSPSSRARVRAISSALTVWPMLG